MQKENSINSITIIGVGLIGGSLGLALKNRFPSITITGVGRNLNRLTLAQKSGCVDKVTTDLAFGVKDADIVVVCTPIKLTIEFIRKILPLVKQGCVITDVASIKYKIIDDLKTDVQKFRKIKDISFVGSHPIAGAEKSGFEYASKDLFKNSVCVVCYDKKLSSQDAFRKIKFLWKSVGAKVVHLDAKTHDKILAATSHLLHLISYGLVKQIASRKNYLTFTAGAYRDMTRIASSNPSLWAEICYFNRSFVLDEMNRFLKVIKQFKERLNDFKKLKRQIINSYKLKVRS
ncbi:MAG: prephenate dehydrogenase [Endomicrobia bacterium]|nr:prephenate dehydrogenase [Endomicrobiia bacterium]MDW8056041.1 prephenate dehydrogenase [Elusimicrobiota bacterium]